MTIKILNMRQSAQHKVKAEFDAKIDGWLVNNCVIIETDPNKGSYMPGDFTRSFLALAPLVSTGVRSVKIPDVHWLPFINAAIDTYLDWVAAGGDKEPVQREERADAGVKRFLEVAA